ncbi:tetratricopeptide repeat protein [Azospirillum picis]|uniref:Tetratricopeptide (TPR) repeat protein n=1 Tax=Azospirillum picis TaxID=488438 RepID=A0ABU0MR73_9PROT|nr:tetratricopeptide repeat protein [Azospirillum picis]MBP2302399.1 tetratricopeptide (TPR) repeat protein [Azospirillum picis]MDQ0535978.1 tetratricopeptide (TPR) repeat protein [Azospirillum picis]
MERLIEAGYEALANGDLARLHRLWDATCVWSMLPDDTVADIADRCRKAIEAGEQGEAPHLVLGAILLDCSAVLRADRAAALREASGLGRRAITLEPSNAKAHRLVGSAHFWLDERDTAAEFYRRSNALRPQIDLQVRLFEMEHEQPAAQAAHFRSDPSDDEPAHYYGAGVTVGKWRLPDGTQSETVHALMRGLYERSIVLFQERIGRAGDAPVDVHSFAMCCNNLGIEYNRASRVEDAARILETGLQYSRFRELYENLRWSYRALGRTEEATETSLTLLEDFELEPSLFLDCAQTACSHLNRIGRSEDVLDLVEAADEAYGEMGDDERMEADNLRYFLTLQAHKVSALSAQARLARSDIDMALVDRAISLHPDELEFALIRARFLTDLAEFRSSGDAYGELIARAHEKDDRDILRKALKARGYLRLYHLDQPDRALEDYQALRALTPEDFYVHYYLADCHFRLKQPHETLEACERALQHLTDGIATNDRLSFGQLLMMQADTLFDLGDYEASLPVYERCLSLIDRPGIRGNYELAKGLARKRKGFFSRLFR